ncbi:MAG TPA: phospho-N-acetylmuramoyl-pentapeptide-transferase [Actinomycetota bacterium]|nr:phospho-N-acetylmuramoyl-pentapeptide-transferase [Actinomycetota bacterium]
MTSIMLAGLVGLVVSLLGTPLAVRRFRRRGWGQLIREEGPKAHYEKRGTPTMGGLVILCGCVLGYAVGHVGGDGFFSPRDSGVLAMGTIVALGLLGFLDDFIKIRKSRNLGLQKRAKFLGQLVIAVAFALIAVQVVDIGTDLSFFRSTALDLGIFFYLWAFLMIAAASNGVNLTDGLDGLAVGSATLVMGAFVVVAFWQFRHPIFYDLAATGSDPFDLAIVASALFGACLGFLWWNTAPAKIFMGDTGSLMLGGAMAVLAILLNTQLLLVILGGLYVVETLSVIVQVAVFKRTGNRPFLMAPIHHHFELAGWPEFTVIVRFWILSGLSVAFGIGLFYADFLSKGAIDL